MFQADPAPEGVTTDIWDLSQGSQVIFSSQQHGCCGNSDPRAAFGFTSGFVEATHAIWQDSAPGVLDFVEWQTPQPVDLSAIALHLADDGSTFRSASDYRLFASQDGVNFSLVSTGVIPADGNGYLNNPLLIADSVLGGTTSAVRAFRLEMTRATGGGTRVAELDATGTAAAPVTAFLDRIAFNDSTNSLTGRGGAGKDDEGAGLGFGYTFSSAVVGGADTVRDAFGGNHGAIEPESFIFGDGGAVDNGNLTLGDAGETVDFIEWHTAQPLSLAGFRIGLSGDGPNPNRDTELVRFFIEGVEVDLFDNNGFDGDVTRFFAGGTALADDFRIETTRTTGSGGRVFEIDAITSVSTGWLGTVGNNNWSSAGNWVGAGPAVGERNLFFGRTFRAAGATGAVTAQNDLVGYVGHRIAFQDSDTTGTTVDGTSAGDTAFTITGNGFTLAEIGANFPRIENNSFVTQTFNLSAGQKITFNDATNHKAEINATNGSLVFSATTQIDLAGTTQLQISGGGGKVIFFNGAITSSGNGGANGVAILGGLDVIFTGANTYSGPTSISASRLFFNTQANLSTSAITAGNGGKLIKNSAGDLTLTNTVTLTDGGGLNSRFSGTLTIGNVSLPGSGFVVFNLDDQPTSKLSLGGPAVALSGAGLTVAVGGANATVGEVTLNQAIGGAGVVTKTGPGKLTLAGPQTYDTLTTEAGRTDLASTLGTGASTINANAETNIGVSQTLAVLNIGDGAVVTLSNPLPQAPAFDGADLFDSNSAQAVPEPGSIALLLLGGALLARRRAK